MVFLVYGRFLVTRIASTAPTMIITMIIATTPYSRAFWVERLLAGVAVGAVVGAGEPA